MSKPTAIQIAAMTVATVAVVVGASGAQAEPTPVKNIVLVHGAFVDGSGWRPVYDILTHDGYHVSMVQEPLSSLTDDVAATRRIVDLQNGPVILVGHSYGGAIITEAGANPKVVGLVYIAAHAPDQGETQSQNAKKYPALGRNAIMPVADGYVRLDPAQFHAEFAADIPSDEAAFDADAQGVTSSSGFSELITVAAWRTKPTWYMVAGADHIINPDLERWYAARMQSRKVVEVPGASHSVFHSHPKEVAALIEEAAQGAAANPSVSK